MCVPGVLFFLLLLFKLFFFFNNLQIFLYSSPFFIPSFFSPVFLFFFHLNPLFLYLYNTVLRISILIGVLLHFPLSLTLEGN